MTLAECPPFRVLAAEAHRDPVLQQRGEGQRLSVGPLEGRPGAEVCKTSLQLPIEFGVDGKALGSPKSGLIHPDERFHRDFGIHRR